MNTITNPEWAIFEDRTPEMFECMDSNGFAVISGLETPDANLVWSINEFKETGKPNDVLAHHIGRRFLELDTAMRDADLPLIESERVEVYANKGFDGSEKPHVDRTFRNGPRCVEVINGTRVWAIEGDKLSVVIIAKPGDILLLRNRASGETRREAVKKSALHSFIAGDEESMSLVYARALRKPEWYLSRLKNRPSKFPPASELMQKYKDGINNGN